MQSCDLVLLSLALLAALVFISKNFLDQNQKKKLPPGPKPWPIIGNLHQIGPLPHQSLHDLAQKYGEIMKLKYGLKTVVVASSPKMAEEFLKTHDRVFASRPPLASGKWSAYNYQDMTWAPYGAHWRMARKIYSTELFTPKRLESLEHIRVDERRQFLLGIYAHRGNSLVLRNHIRKYTLSTIIRVALSNTYFNDQNNTGVVKLTEFVEMLDEWFILNGVLNIGDWIPFLSVFDLQGYVKRMKILKDKFDTFYKVVIADHESKMEAAGENFVSKDMVDVLLSLTRKDVDPDTTLTDDALKGLVHDLLAGGTDTSAVTVEWAMHELFLHPHVAKKAREEINSVVGQERWVEEEDYPRLPYIDAIIKETVRLHPLAPLLAPHYALEDCNVAGYHVAKDTVILVNTWSIHRNLDCWDEPSKFKPERFLQGREIDMTGKDFSLLPFGSGRRRCPAYSLGLKMVRTTISNMLHGFDWNFPEGFTHGDICMVERYGLTTCPEVPITVIPEPRLSSNLYQ